MLYVYSQQYPPFTHGSHIPTDFALSVYHIMHNTATAHSWEVIDKYAGKKEPIFQWIEDILKSNKVQNIQEEINWWKTQLSRAWN